MLRACAAHDAAGVRADRAGQPDLGADRRLGRACGRASAQIVQPIAQFLAAFPANLLFPRGRLRHRDLEAQPGHLAEPADDPGHAVVHPVQRHRRRLGDAGRAALCGAEFRRQGWLWWRKVALPAVLPFYVTGRHHRLRRLVERGASSPNSPAGATPRCRREGLGAYIAEADDRRRLSPHRAGHRDDEPVRRGHQPLFWRPLYYYAERKFRLT